MNKLFYLLSAMLLSSCATLMTMEAKEPYAGTRLYGQAWAAETCDGAGCGIAVAVLRPLSLIDFPLTLVGDTLMLPVKGIQNLLPDKTSPQQQPDKPHTASAVAPSNRSGSPEQPQHTDNWDNPNPSAHPDKKTK